MNCPLFLLLSSMSGWAQGSARFADAPFFEVYLISAGVVVLLILVIVVGSITYRVFNLIAEITAIEKAAHLGITYIPKPAWWEKIWQNANALVPLGEEKSIELDHNYDGIRELDNHLPPWWKGLFYGTIVFAVVYMILFHVSNSLPLQEQEYLNEVSKTEDQVRMLKALLPKEVIDENTLAFTNDPVIITRGKSLFVSSNCGSCHRNDGGGNTIGPNLTDPYWLHGGDIKNIFTTIKTGVVEKAMPAWGKVMSLNDVRGLAFYVMSLQGTNPQNAKGPQGEVFKPQQKTLTNDSTNVQTPLKK